MTPRQLDDGFRRAFKKTFGMRSILRRITFREYVPITLVGNLAYRIYVRRLQRDRERILPYP